MLGFENKIFASFLSTLEVYNLNTLRKIDTPLIETGLMYTFCELKHCVVLTDRNFNI